VVLWSYDIESAVFGPIGESYLVVGDLTGDSLPEVVFGTAGGWLHVVDGVTHDSLWTAEIGGYVKWGSPVLAELTGDGLLDVVVGASSSKLCAFRGYDGYLLWTAMDTTDVVGVTVADLENDGVPEVVAGDWDSPRYVRCFNATSGVELWATQISGSMYNIPCTWDMDGNGRREIFFTAHWYAPLREFLYCLSWRGGVLWTRPSAPTAAQLANTPPELGYLPDYGYVSAAVADFDADGHMEVGRGTDLNYIVREADSSLVWKSPTGILGNGFTMDVYPESVPPDTVYTDHHYQIFDAAVADMDGDGGADVVLGMNSDYTARWVHSSQGDTFSVTSMIYRNRARCLRGSDGVLLWEFDGEYPTLDAYGRGWMWYPVAADLDGNGAMDVLIPSMDGHIYAVRGSDGQKLWDFSAGGYQTRRGIAIADLDGDGSGEILAGDGGGIRALGPVEAPWVSGRVVGTGVLLWWPLAGQGVDHYVVYRGAGQHINEQSASPIGTVYAPDSTYSDATPGIVGDAGTNYSWFVVAWTSAGKRSGPSNIIGEFDFSTGSLPESETSKSNSPARLDHPTPWPETFSPLTQ
jgi:hypothetical protein